MDETLQSVQAIRAGADNPRGQQHTWFNETMSPLKAIIYFVSRFGHFTAWLEQKPVPTLGPHRLSVPTCLRCSRIHTRRTVIFHNGAKSDDLNYIVFAEEDNQDETKNCVETDTNTDPWPGYRYTGKLRPHYPLVKTPFLYISKWC